MVGIKNQRGRSPGGLFGRTGRLPEDTLLRGLDANVPLVYMVSTYFNTGGLSWDFVSWLALRERLSHIMKNVCVWL